MEYKIGVSDADVKLRRLIENRLPVGAKLGGDLCVCREDGLYVTVACEGKEGLFALGDVLADIVIENLQIRYIMKKLAHDYMFVAEKDQCDILVNTLKKLWYCGEQSNIERAKHDVAGRIVACLLEGGGTLSLDGVMRFRMKDCTKVWGETLEECVEDYLIESEEQEFIKLLRYFVSMREPLMKRVRIADEGDEYLIYDQHGTRINVSVEGDAGKNATKEDLLISRLINLAPEHIDLSAVEDAQLTRLIRQVFVGRVEDNCEI